MRQFFKQYICYYFIIIFTFQKFIERIQGQPNHMIKKESQLFTGSKAPGESIFANQPSPQIPSGSSASTFGKQQTNSSKWMLDKEKAKSIFSAGAKNSSAQKSLFKMVPSNLKGGEAHGIAGRTMFGGHLVEGKKENKSSSSSANQKAISMFKGAATAIGNTKYLLMLADKNPLPMPISSTKYMAIPAAENKAIPISDTKFLALSADKNPNETKFMIIPAARELWQKITSTREIIDIKFEWQPVLEFFRAICAYPTISQSAPEIFIEHLRQSRVDGRIIKLWERLFKILDHELHEVNEQKSLFYISLNGMIQMMRGNILGEGYEQFLSTKLVDKVELLEKAISQNISNLGGLITNYGLVENCLRLVLSEMSQTFNLLLIQIQPTAYNLLETYVKKSSEK